MPNYDRKQKIPLGVSISRLDGEEVRERHRLWAATYYHGRPHMYPTMRGYRSLKLKSTYPLHVGRFISYRLASEVSEGNGYPYMVIGPCLLVKNSTLKAEIDMEPTRLFELECALGRSEI